ncbi:MAG: glutaminyl-peptide cyclotransferase [Thermoplasmata archaeon]|nr:glutaminyl-peptide cyclotransferase [Thermoplasmata archaeon]
MDRKPLVAGGPVVAVRVLPATLAVLLLAGCLGPSTQSTTTPAPPAKFDGQAAYSFVEGLVSEAGGPRFRVPGTPAHARAAAWLEAAMQVPGWTVAWQNFTGAEYQAMPKGGVAGYTTQCDIGEPERVKGLEFHNLVARWDGGDTGRTMALGAHWESKKAANRDLAAANQTQPVLGANDGASGVGILLQLMRHVAAHGGPAGVDLTIVLFDGEDGFEDCHPLAGSIAFVQALEPGEVDRMLLLDMVGDPAARFIQETRGCDPGMAALFARHAPRLGLADNFLEHKAPIYDDHLPFAEAGIPALDLLDAGRPTTFPPYWHTSHDTLANISPAMLGRVGDLVAASLLDPDFTAQWPASCAQAAP